MDHKYIITDLIGECKMVYLRINNQVNTYAITVILNFNFFMANK